MYKKRFAQWGWRKYAPRIPHRQDRPRDRTIRTCRRNADQRQGTLNLACTADGLVECTLRDIKLYFAAHQENDFWGWGKWSPINGVSEIRSGVRHISRNDLVTGKQYIYYGVGKLATTLRRFDIETTRDVLCSVLKTIIHFRQEGLVQPYLSYIVRRCGSDLIQNTVRHFASRLLKIWQTSPRHLAQLIGSWQAVEFDCLAEIKPRSTRALQYKKLGQLITAKQLRQSMDYDQEVRQVVMNYDRLIRQAEDLGDDDTAYLLTLWSIRLQHDVSVYLDDFAERCRRCIDANHPENFPQDGGYQHTECLLVLTVYHLRSHDISSAVVELELLVEALDLGARVNLQSVDLLCTEFKGEGRGDLAQKIGDMLAERRELANACWRLLG